MKKSEYYKIRVAVPLAAADQVRQAMNAAGASKQGNYDFVSFSTRGMGRFRPLAGAKPAIGKQGKIEQVEEEMIESLCHKDDINNVIEAIKIAHPYEEPAIDIFIRCKI